MARYIQIQRRDYDQLVAAIQYVVERRGKNIDATMEGYLTGVVREVDRHVRGDSTCVENSTLFEIDLVQAMLGADNGPMGDSEDS